MIVSETQRKHNAQAATEMLRWQRDYNAAQALLSAMCREHGFSSVVREIAGQVTIA